MRLLGLFNTLMRLSIRLTWTLVGVLSTARKPVGYFSLTRVPLNMWTIDTVRGYPHSNLRSRLYGGGGYALHGEHMLIGGEGGGGGLKRRTDAFRTDGGGGFGNFQVGYALTLGPLRVFPFAGIGGGGSGASSVQTPDDTATASRSSFGGGGVRLLYGLGAELHLGGRYELVLGLRMGYARQLIGLGGEALDGKLTGFGLRWGGWRPYFQWIVGAGQR